MDNGLTQALTQMYSGPSVAQEKQSEFARLEQMSRFYEKDALEQEAAAAKMQAYDKQVDDFADKLLGADRKRLFEKSRVLKQSVREMIKQNGGDMKSFFSSGGHQVMAEYKSALTQSDEASDYLDNKQNMAFILKAMNEGKGHLISPKDKENFDRYMADGKGKITYSGVMNEIKMPDASKYRGGVTMKVDDILNENRMAIMANYATYYKGTSLDPTNENVPPTQEQLLAFTAMMYGSQIGSNYNIDIAKNQEIRAQNEEQRRQQSHYYDVTGKAIQNEDAITTATRNKVGLDQDKLGIQKTLLELDAYSNKTTEYSQKGANGQYSEEDVQAIDKIAQELEPETISPINDLALNISDLDKYNPRPGNIFNATDRMVKGNDFFRQFLGPRYTETNAQVNYTGTNSFFDPGSTDDVLSILDKKYHPAAAYQIKDNSFKDAYKLQVAKFLTGDEKSFDYKSNAIKDWKPGKDMTRVYHADGTNLAGTHSSMWGSSDYNDEYKGDYKIKNVIVAAVDETKDGRKQIIMSRNGRKVDENVYNSKNKPRLSTFAVIQQAGSDPNRPVFYVEIDPSNDGDRGLLAATTNVTKSRKDMEKSLAKKSANEATYKGVSQALKKDLYNLRTNSTWQSTAQAIAGDGTYGDPDLLNSYLAVVQSAYKQKTGKPYTLDEITRVSSKDIFTYLTPEKYKKIKSDPRYGVKGFFQEIILQAKSPASKQLIELWQKNYFELKQR